MEKSKSRTTITIHPDLWDKAKAYCEKRTAKEGKLFSFSEMVEKALVNYINSNVEFTLKDPGILLVDSMAGVGDCEYTATGMTWSDDGGK